MHGKVHDRGGFEFKADRGHRIERIRLVLVQLELIGCRSAAGQVVPVIDRQFHTTCADQLGLAQFHFVRTALKHREVQVDQFATRHLKALTVQTGDMDKMLEKIAHNFDEEADVLVGSLMSLLEPIMILMLGGLVGTIVVAMFLPMISMITVLM